MIARGARMIMAFPIALILTITHTHMHTQYLGATEVTKTHGPGSTDDAVKKIVHHVSKAHVTIYPLL